MDAVQLEGIERDAAADEWRAATDELRSRLVLGWSEIDGALVTRLERVDNDWLNRVIGLGMTTPVKRRALVTIVETFRAAGLKHFSVQVAPGAQPAELPAWLGELGMSVTARWAKLVRQGGESVEHSCSLRIAPVEPRDAPEFGRVSCAGWGLPPPLVPWMAQLVGRDRWRAYLAWDGGEPVAAGLLFLDEKLAWLGGDTTLPSARGRGAQSALIARRIADAGPRLVVAETLEDNESFRNCLKSGFQRAYVRESFTQSASK
jgi:hypothetical protein